MNQIFQTSFESLHGLHFYHENDYDSGAGKISFYQVPGLPVYHNCPISTLEVNTGLLNMLSPLSVMIPGGKKRLSFHCITFIVLLNVPPTHSAGGATTTTNHGQSTGLSSCRNWRTACWDLPSCAKPCGDSPGAPGSLPAGRGHPFYHPFNGIIISLVKPFYLCLPQYLFFINSLKMMSFPAL